MDVNGNNMSTACTVSCCSVLDFSYFIYDWLQQLVYDVSVLIWNFMEYIQNVE